MKLMIIWGSTRQGRKGGVVAKWVKDEAAKDSRFEVDFVDLREPNLPFFDEPTSPFSMKSLNDYTHPEGRAWAERVEKADAVIVVTPEYNHGPPGVLKNALDWVGKPWIDKPLGLISYGGIAGGARAVEQLRAITTELGLIQVATPLHFPYFEKAFDANGQPERSDYYSENLKKMLNEITRLQAAFSRGEPAS
ncbi:NAD(P)H-dependent oxidoreductase [Candidatus Saccharibacteria bacterium]|nr:NAD(P)H-dependent oxidoreductase [Candidatus Saccharibacteria bacterium]